MFLEYLLSLFVNRETAMLSTHGHKNERKKILTSPTVQLACFLTNLGVFLPLVGHLPSENSILSNFSSPRGVAILGCESHSQAGLAILDSIAVS